jgi:hypothetical protein
LGQKDNAILCEALGFAKAGEFLLQLSLQGLGAAWQREEELASVGKVSILSLPLCFGETPLGLSFGVRLQSSADPRPFQAKWSLRGPDGVRHLL